jgi:hypothetical protein
MLNWKLMADSGQSTRFIFPALCVGCSSTEWKTPPCMQLCSSVCREPMSVPGMSADSDLNDIEEWCLLGCYAM